MNSKSTEGLIPITVENSSWTASSRDWSEEVERVSADGENDFNSSPQHHADSDLTRHSDMKQKQTLRNSQPQSIVYNDLLKCAGIGRGKFKVKSTNTLNTERRTSDTGLLCNNVEMNSDAISPDSVEDILVDSNSSCNSPYPEEICGNDLVKDTPKKSPVFSNPGEEDTLSIQTHINGAFPSQGDIRTRNMPIPNMDQSRDYDYKKMANGMDTFRGYRNKPRMNRVPSNNANTIQYAKGYDNRPFGHRYPPPQPSMPSINVKNYRPVKPHENHYRHYDNRRHQQSSRPPFSVSPIDKVAYAKHKSNIYSERDFLDVNRNFPSQNFAIPNELNRHISGPVSYVPQTNVPTFRSKHNSRLLNCEKLVCNKNEPYSSNPKNWSFTNVMTDSNTSTVSCHNRTVVTPMKTMVSPQCAACTTHPHEKHCPSLKEDSQQKKNYPNPCDTYNPNHSQSYNAIEAEPRSKLNNSPVYDIRKMRIPRDDSNITSNCERLSATDITNSNHDYMPTSTSETKNYFTKSNSPDPSDTFKRDGNFFASHLRKDFPDKATVSSPSVSSANVPLPKQSSGNYCNADNSQVLALHEESYRTSPVSAVPHSYADVIRIPADTVNNVSPCLMANCMELTVSKSNDYSNNFNNEKLNPKIETDHNSSEWILSKLSQIDINTDLVAVSNVSQQVVNPPRPIAVNLEKPSFYNSKTGVTGTVNVNIQPSNLSSPERKMLECQYVEEQLGTMLGYKKAGEKLTFLSDVSHNLIGSGDPSSVCIPSNIRTDSTFSDTSSVCSSMSGTFKGEGHYQIPKSSTPPVIIMNNNYGTQEAVSEISFGIEMDEIMKLCGDSDLDSVGDSSMTMLSDSGFCSSKVLDVATCEIEDEEDSCLTNQNENYVIICNKKLLWKDTVDISNCNMPQIVGFLQESVGEGDSSAVKFYSEE